MPIASRPTPGKSAEVVVTPSDVAAVQRAAEEMFGKMIAILATARAAGDAKFFKNGVELIDLTVSAKQLIEIKLKIAGPKPATDVAETSA